jgi:lipid II:glycine glycyltransferase (peptidoglycan interpeptide bridge formation enzyme)
MTFEICSPARYPEADDFIMNHPLGGFTQCSRWAAVKCEWDHRVVVSRDQNKDITGALLVLIRPIPFLKTVMLYAPRGPVCRLDDMSALTALKAGVDSLAQTHRACVFLCDPDVPMENAAFITGMKALGFHHSFGPTGFEGIQARFNYRTRSRGSPRKSSLQSSGKAHAARGASPCAKGWKSGLRAWKASMNLCASCR